jgi:hypothetical protein
MVKGFNLQAWVFIPYAGTDVSFGHDPRFPPPFVPPGGGERGAGQALLQQTGKEMVIAVAVTRAGGQPTDALAGSGEKSRRRRRDKLAIDKYNLCSLCADALKY